MNWGTGMLELKPIVKKKRDYWLVDPPKPCGFYRDGDICTRGIDGTLCKDPDNCKHSNADGSYYGLPRRSRH
jgi:hypothetical protein